jgi:MFS family permease
VELLVIVASLEVLGMGQSGAGWLAAAWAVGGLLGVTIAAGMAHRTATTRAFAAGGVGAGAALAALAAAPPPILALLLLVAVGVGLAVVDASTAPLARRAASTEPAPGEEVVHALARTAGAFLAAWLATELGDTDALMAAGLLVAALGLYVARPALPRRIRTVGAT